jgi:hypothetical protein
MLYHVLREINKSNSELKKSALFTHLKKVAAFSLSLLKMGKGFFVNKLWDREKF